MHPSAASGIVACNADNVIECELEDGVTSGDQNKKFHQKISDLHLDEGESGAQSHNEPEGQETVADHASQPHF